MPVFDYKCSECELIAEDVLVDKAEDEILCEDCDVVMYKLPSTFSIHIGSPWVKQVENKYGVDGNPYRDEEGNKRPGVDDSYPVRPGPRTKARWKRASKEIQKIDAKKKEKKIITS